MTDKIKRSRNFFRDIVFKKDKTVYADDIDSQFNEVTDYFNDVLKPAIDTLVSEAVQGIAGNTGAFLHNIGDGSTDWQYVKSDGIDDFSITFEKLVKHTASSVLIADASGGLSTIPANSSNEVLLSREANTPIWQLVTSDHIEPKTLTGQKLGLLSMENFQHNLFAVNVKDDVINTEHIANSNITNDKLLDNSITVDKLGVFDNLPHVTQNLTVNNIDDYAILADKIKDNTIPVYYYIQGSNTIPEVMMRMWSANENRIQQPNGVHVWKMILPTRAILNNSIDDSKLHNLSLQSLSYNISHPNGFTDVKKSLFDYYAVDAAFQFQSDHIDLDSLGEDDFDDEVKAAINRL